MQTKNQNQAEEVTQQSINKSFEEIYAPHQAFIKANFGDVVEIEYVGFKLQKSKFVKLVHKIHLQTPVFVQTSKSKDNTFKSKIMSKHAGGDGPDTPTISLTGKQIQD